MRSEALWEEANKKFIDRLRSYPITINGKRWDEWEPTITDNLGQSKLPWTDGRGRM